MNKKKACIESLAALEPNIKIRKQDGSEITFSSEKVTVTAGDPAAAANLKPTENEKESKLMNPYVFNTDVVNGLQHAYSLLSSYNEDPTGIQLHCYPFRYCVLPNFLNEKVFMTQLEKELKNIKLKRKNNDLYQFRQSIDLKHNKSSTVIKMRSQLELLKGFLSNVTGIPLNDKIDLFCSHYKYTDYLLCHDDELDDRRIAFIYYLVPETWSPADGGALDLFDTDDDGQPKDIVKSILPSRNNFIFFEVSPKSFHQVAEILSEDKTRLSLTGWFHGPTLHRPPPCAELLPQTVPYGNIEEKVFYSWFNPTYLAPEMQKDIRETFIHDSFILLSNFLDGEKYKELESVLKSEGMSWNQVGPANKSHYLSAKKDALPSIVAEFLKVIHSDAFFLVLSNLTGLDLHPLAIHLEGNGTARSNGASSSSESPDINCGKSSSRCRSEIRKWQHGDYTLARDTDPEISSFSLDTMLYIGCGADWSQNIGGYTAYIAKGDYDELLTMAPHENHLALVYRDIDCMRVVKHINHRITKLPTPNFYEVNCVYYE